MDEKEPLKEIKQNKEIVKSYNSKKEIFGVEFNGERYTIPRERVEDKLGDDCYSKLRKKLEDEKQ